MCLAFGCSSPTDHKHSEVNAVEHLSTVLDHANKRVEIKSIYTDACPAAPAQACATATAT